MKYKKVWEVSGKSLPSLCIEADSFDEAIEEARKVNEKYCSGQVIGK